jgi:hypothetical protein
MQTEMMSLVSSGNRNILLAFFLLVSLGVKAQQSSNIYTGDSLLSAQKKVILVPFDPILYNSEIDRELAKTNNLSFDEIREKFRMSMDFQAGMFLKQRFYVIAPFREKDEQIKNDLRVIYKGIAFNYVPLKTAKETSAKSKRSEIRNGQLVEVDNSGAKYMSTVIKDEKLLPYLNTKYGSELYVFVTQFEILNDMTDEAALAAGRYPRYVRIHYSILDNEGKTVNGGILRSLVPNNLYDIKKISETALRDIGQQIVDAIPVVTAK